MMRSVMVVCALMVGVMSVAQEDVSSASTFSEDNEIVRVARLREAPELKIFMFPNPCFGEVTVRTDANAAILILDETGREVVKSVSGEDGQAFIGGLLTGVYYVVVVSENRRALSKLVVL